MELNYYAFPWFFLGIILLAQVVHTEALHTDENEEFSEFRKRLEDLTSTVHLQSKYIGILQRTVQQQGRLLRRMGLKDESNYKSYKVFDNETAKQTVFSKSNGNHFRTSRSAALTEDRKSKADGNTTGIFRKERLLYQPTPSTQTDENVIAFYAYLSTDVNSLGLSETLKYDVVKTNQGNSYHSSSGVFVAPESGYYVFTWTVRSYHYGDSTAESFSTELVIDGTIYGSAFLRAHLEDDNQSTGTVVAYINKGQDVYVRTHSSYAVQGSIRSNTHGRSCFSGWKIN
ncbi:uncharacterized protein LOC130054232 [Ostrea edulis]|uniref:uncharacterized protein LOC130054232 n=1 Tax=Ostrea edulis TaxID=37623 RepID=UPI0024AFB998|nr:uncharacterized protein LOC130054232 [Ostrea edulis]